MTTTTWRRDYHAFLADDLKRRDIDRRVRAARIAACRGELGPDAQVIALARWVCYLVQAGHTEAARRVRSRVHQLNAAIEKGE